MTDPDSSQTVPERLAESVRNQFDSEDSRRTFLQRTAAAGGGLLLLGTGTTFAQQDDQQTGSDEMFDDQSNTDLDVLNYVLSVKRLQRDLYSQGLEEFSQGDFTDGQEDGETTTPGEDEDATDEEDGETTTPGDEGDGNETTAPDDGDTTGSENDTSAPDDGNTTSPGNETTAPGDGNTTSPDDNGTTSPLQEAQPTTGDLYSALEQFSSQKEEHVSILEQTVQLLGGQGMEQPDQDGGVTQPDGDDNTTDQSDEDFEDTIEQPDQDDNTTDQPSEEDGNTTVQPQQDDTGTTQPGQETEYEFEFEDADDFLQTAAEIENTVVGAHAGVARYLESPDLLNALLSVYGVDARHAGVVSRAAGQSAAPEAFVQALSQSEVQETVSQYSGRDGMDTGDDTDMDDGEDDDTGIGGDDEDTGIGGDDTNGNETDSGGIGGDTNGNETDDGGIGDDTNGNETGDDNVTGSISNLFSS